MEALNYFGGWSKRNVTAAALTPLINIFSYVQYGYHKMLELYDFVNLEKEVSLVDIIAL